MNGLLLGKIGALNIIKKDNSLLLDCVLVGEGYCLNPATKIFTITLDFNEEGKEDYKAETNNNLLFSLWSWMTAAKVDNFNQLIGQNVVIEVKEDVVINFHVVDKEESERLMNIAKEQEQEEKN